MLIDKPIPFLEAIDFLRQKTALPTTLSTAELEQIDASIRRAAKFSARVAQKDFIAEAFDLIGQIVNPQHAGSAAGTYMDVPRFRETIKEYLAKIGYTPEEDQQGTLQDLGSDPRLNLIAETNAQMAQGYGQAIQGNDPVVLDAFPCQELFRLENKLVPRGFRRGPGGALIPVPGEDWPSRWRANGGKFYGGGRMIARKDDPIWVAISRFGNPYPPFDFNSGMWTREISRKEAIAFGVMAGGDQVAPQKLDLAKNLQASLSGVATELQEALQKSLPGAVIKDGVLTMGAA